MNFQEYVLSRRYWKDFEVLSNGVVVLKVTNLNVDPWHQRVTQFCSMIVARTCLFE